MPKKIVWHESPFLHCDNPQCKLDIPVHRIDESFVDCACPACGSNLLTEQDWKVYQRYLKVCDWINFLFGWLGTEAPPQDARRLKFHMHNGRMRQLIDE